MDILINNFRSIDIETQYRFEPQSLTLVSGVSGVGKSTIFESIQFCLYGGKKNIYPRGKKVKDTYVICTISNQYRIERRKNPDTVSMMISGKTYEADEAQLYINDLFGTREVFRSCCYLSQGNKCELISASSSTRFDLLRSFIFKSSDDPSNTLQKIYTHLTTCKTSIQNVDTQMNMLNNRISSYRLSSVDKKPLTEDEEVQLRDRLQQNKSTLNTYNEHNTRQKQLIEQRNKISSRLIKTDSDNIDDDIDILSQEMEIISINGIHESAQKKYDDYVQGRTYDIIPSHLHSVNYNSTMRRYRLYKEFINRCEEYKIDINNFERERSSRINEMRSQITEIQYKNQYDNIRSQLKEIVLDKDTISKIPHNITDQQMRYKRFLSSCSCMKCISSDTYSEDIRMLRENIEQDISTLRYWHIRSKWLRNRVTEPSYTSDELRDKISQLEQIITQKRIESKRYECPHCNNQIYIHNGSCHKISVSDNDTSQDISKLNTYKTDLNNALQYEKWLRDEPTNTINTYNVPRCEDVIVDIRNKLCSMPSYVDEPITMLDINTIKLHRSYYELKRYDKQHNVTIDELKNRISQLQNIVRYDKPMYVDEMLQYGDNFEFCVKATQLYNAIPQSTERKRKTSYSYNECSRRLREYREQQSLIKSLERLDKPSELYDTTNLINEISSVESTLNELPMLRAYHKDVEQYRNLQLSRNTYSDHSIATKRLVEIAEQTECKVMDTSIDTINFYLNQYVSIIFEEPISVILKSTSITKTTNRIKRNIHLKIDHRGREIEELTVLSGGERDRISLALCLALSTMSSFPFLVLDEVMSSLDAESRERCRRCIELLREFKGCIVVNHMDDPSYYTHHIPL
jgi:DNA repair exonuclease SbcCD ATPase subunit